MKDRILRRYIIWRDMTRWGRGGGRKGFTKKERERERLTRRMERRRSGLSYKLGQGYESANFRKVSRVSKITPPFARGSFAWQSAKQPRRSSNHLTRLTENGTTASALELLPAISSLSRLKKKKKSTTEAFLGVDKLADNERLFCEWQERECVYCTSSRLSASEYSKRNRFCMQNSLIVRIT